VGDQFSHILTLKEEMVILAQSHQ
jgi:hypothetical protein